MRDWENKAGVICIAGVAAAALGFALRLEPVSMGGLAVLGAGVACWGLGGLIGGRISFWRRNSPYAETFHGLAARARGALLCLAGAVVVGCGLTQLLIPDVSFTGLADSPLATGFGMLIGGLAGALYAVTLILGRAGDGGSWVQRALSLPGRLLGVVVLLASVPLAAAGAMRIAAPQVYEAAVRLVSGLLPPAPH